jgi:hypothetical protein
MKIKHFFILTVAIAFVVIHCNPALASDSLSVSSEVYYGDESEIDFVDQKLKSPQDIGIAPVIEVNEYILKAQPNALPDDSPRQRIGFARSIESLSDHRRFKETLNWWEIQDGGHTATLIISSPEAKALRVGIVLNKLPQETEFRFFEINNETNDMPATLITGEQINYLLQLNREADPDHPDSQTYWSPTVAGESIGIEIYLPPGIHPDNFNIAIPFLSHLEVSPLVSTSESFMFKDYGDSDSCQNDATCYSSWVNVGNAVAKMEFTESGYTYLCTGTLLNDADASSWIPYFITANHCIGSQTVASTLETHWFFESAWCNSTTRNSNYEKKSGGAKLHWTSGWSSSNQTSSQDVSFLELNTSPPPGVSYAGWTTDMGSGEVTGIHHPLGDWKKLSMGDQGGDYIIWGNGYVDRSSAGNFRRVDWTDGGTEGGSSGSGLFKNYDQLVGILSGGNSESCGGYDYYSKFGAAYSTGNLSKWLNPGTTCTYSISPSSVSFPYTGGTSSVSVTASGSDCTWNTSESLSWVSLSPTSGKGSQTVTAAITANTGSARSGSVLIAGKTYTISQAATDMVREFVNRFYQVVLGRSADSAGLNYWTENLKNGTMAGADVAREFILSDEFINRALDNAAYVQVLYAAFFDREPDQSGYSHWINSLNNGVNRSEVLNSFISSQEFIDLCQAYGIRADRPEDTVSEFVNRFYQVVLGRSADSAGLNYWTENLKNGTMAGADVAREFILSDEFINRALDNAAYVQVLYAAFFDREPDQSGYSHWINSLNNGVNRSEVLNSFISSQEFIDLCQAYGIRAER